MIVEDELLLRAMLSDYLQHCGYRTFEAPSATEAVQLIEANTWPIDLVFTDVHMPGEKDGLWLAQWLRTHRPELPVVLCSGDQSKAEQAKDLCYDQPLFAKPYDFDALAERIKNLLAAKKDGT